MHVGQNGQVGEYNAHRGSDPAKTHLLIPGAAKRKRVTKVHSAASRQRNKKLFRFTRLPNLATVGLPQSNASENLWSPAAKAL